MSRAKRYDRLLRTNGIHPNGGPTTKLEAKPKKRSANAISKAAAEAKRRKIESDNADPAADDDDDDDEDVKPVIPKIEPSADTIIKQEKSAGFPLFAYPPTYMSPPHPYLCGYAPPPTKSPVSSYAVSGYASAPDLTQLPSHPIWQPLFQSLTDPALSMTNTTSSSTSTRASRPLPEAAVKTPEQETVVLSTTETSTFPSALNDQTLQNDWATESDQLESVLVDFCNSDLFMPPLTQRKSAPPSLLPAQPKAVDTEVHKISVNGVDAFSSNSELVHSTPSQQNIIVID
jgi:hypothetical protein